MPAHVNGGGPRVALALPGGGARGAYEIGAIARWREMCKGDVIRRIVGPRLPLAALRAVGDALDVPGLRLTGLLDPAPLPRSLERWIDWHALRANVRDRRVDAGCVVATSLERGGPVAFVEREVGRR